MRPNTVLELICKHAEEMPNKICVADRYQSVTYKEMVWRIQEVAGYLLEHGVKKGDVVGLRSLQSAEFVACFFGIQWIGAVACPIENSASVERAQEVLAQISSRYMLDTLEHEMKDVEVFPISDALAFTDHRPEMARIKREDISEIIFTTGTTGKSKGIMVSHRCNVAIAENVIDSVELTSDEVEMLTSPTSHSLAIRRLYAAMYIGSSVVFSENFLLYDNFWGMIEKYKVTAITLVPAMLNLLLTVYHDKIRTLDKQLNYIQLGSAPLHESVKRQLVEMLPNTRLYNTYGSTESGCTIILEFSRYGNKPCCIGRTTVNTQLFFTDESKSKIVEARDEKTAGYLAFRGEMNMSGYVGDPEMTAEVLSEGVIYTNDIGYRGNDGLVYLLGRSGEVINRGGYKINPLEIEEVVGKLEGVKDCACVPMTDDRLGELPKLFIVCEDGFSMTNEQIKSYIRSALEDYKVPTSIERIETIPRTFNGKIIRKQLIEHDRCSSTPAS